ncbi:MAG: hypothetical protein MO853_06935 [Candidatus Protistobacter heckmanni]|nr:hypothetical protein [Candidatus Protistobacter heckmanni]
MLTDEDLNDPSNVDGTLERLLTGTPFTEFDSVYAFRGIADEYLRTQVYRGEAHALDVAGCQAAVLELAAARTAHVEVSAGFVGCWQIEGGVSPRQERIKCLARMPRELEPALLKLHWPVPAVRVLLMKATAELGLTQDGAHYLSTERTGACEPAALSHRADTVPKAVRLALLGRKEDGAPLVEEAGLTEFFDAVVGIDTEGPEVTCFSADGMRGITGGCSMPCTKPRRRGARQAGRADCWFTPMSERASPRIIRAPLRRSPGRGSASSAAFRSPMATPTPRTPISVCCSTPSRPSVPSAPTRAT